MTAGPAKTNRRRSPNASCWTCRPLLFRRLHSERTRTLTSRHPQPLTTLTFALANGRASGERVGRIANRPRRHSTFYCAASKAATGEPWPDYLFGTYVPWLGWGRHAKDSDRIASPNNSDKLHALSAGSQDVPGCPAVTGCALRPRWGRRVRNRRSTRTTQLVTAAPCAPFVLPYPRSLRGDRLRRSCAAPSSFALDARFAVHVRSPTRAGGRAEARWRHDARTQAGRGDRGVPRGTGRVGVVWSVVARTHRFRAARRGRCGGPRRRRRRARQG